MDNPLAPFLIRIFGPNDAVIGAGFLVSERHALTCAHVVADALGIARTTRDRPAGEVSFDFPLPSPSRRLQAKVVHWVPMRSEAGQPAGDEDIAWLEILDDLPDEYLRALLATEGAAADTKFWTFGFPANYDRGVSTDGYTKGGISDRCVMIEGAKAFGHFVESGFSGAPVWSDGFVIGMIVRADPAERSAYMIPARLLPQEVWQALKPRRLDTAKYEQALRRRKVAETKCANPYLLGDKFVGREKELGDLTNWLVGEENRIICLCDLGGTGKSALVWHWLNRPATRAALKKCDMRQYWCTFYARDFDAMKFLRKLAQELGHTTIIAPDVESAQRELQRFILDRLRQEKWLLVLDGLEREMGAFANPEHYQKDSEEQDRRNEKGDVWPMERDIRNPVFADFLRELSATPTKVLITSRLFPADLLTLGGEPLPGVRRYDFVPMSPADAAKIWNLCGEPDDSPFQQEFFARVKFHPQVISVVAAAAKQRSLSLHEWFSEFSATERQACLDAGGLLTARRHRWLELAVRDLIQHRPDAWLTLCYIVRRSEAGNVDKLMKSLVDTAPASEARPGRFRSEVKLRDELDYLVERRLIGVGVFDEEEMADVHPVIRGLVMDYILKTYVQGGEAGKYLMAHLEADGELRELRLRLLDRLALEEGVESLKELDKDADKQPDMLNLLGLFYPKAGPGGRPWLDGLPELRRRKDQAYLLHRTGSELMTQGLWDESTAVLNRAIIAYRLCGDLKSIEDCRRSHNWQSLYNGALWEAEREQLQASGGKYTPYWLALLLAIRQSKHAAALLQSLPADTNRWTLQTVAEAWFYLEDYERAAALARQAVERRETEKDTVGQWLWEEVTLGLALVRLGKCAEAEPHLSEAKARGTGWAYNLVPMFALAGFIELQYREAMKINPGRMRLDALKKPDLVFKQYRKSDPNNSFQIPAAEAHLAMARVHLARQERDEARTLAQRALAVARGKNPPFYYGSVVKRATQFLTDEFGEPLPPHAELSLEAMDHEDRLREWLEKWQEARQ